MPRKFIIVGMTDKVGPSNAVTKDTVQKLSEEFGRNLDTVPKARQWLTNPHNWHEGQMFIIKWDGLLCTVSRTHGQRLIDEPHDSGLPEVVVREQYRLKKGGKQERDDASGDDT